MLVLRLNFVYDNGMEPEDAIIYQSPVPFIKVKGSHREIGRQIGESARPLVEHSIASAKVLVDLTYNHLQLDWNGANIQARKYLPFVQERYPQYVEEIIGIAEGANVSYDDLVVLHAMEAVTMDALHLTKCTSMGVDEQHTANGHVLIAHNEDWIPEDEADVMIIHAEPDDEPPWIAMTYGGLLPNIGMNAFGLAQCCDSVYPNDCRIGIPRIIASRAVLGSRLISDAIRHMIVPLRAAGYNHLLGHESGELYNIEVSARHFALIRSEDGYIVHTNHYLDPAMQAIEDEPDELISTRVRFSRAMHLLKNERSADHPKPAGYPARPHQLPGFHLQPLYQHQRPHGPRENHHQPGDGPDLQTGQHRLGQPLQEQLSHLPVGSLNLTGR